MEQFRSLPSITVRLRRLRTYRLLANALVPLLVVALAVLVFRWMFPWTFSLVVDVWSADAVLLLILAIPWLLVSGAFALGKVKCPSCEGPFTARFHLWIPKACQCCGYDVTAPASAAPTGHRHNGPHA